jgi:hypothetical protein
MSNGTNTTRLAREELRDEFGEYLSDDDNGVVQSTLSRHRLTLSEHDRRRSMSLSYRAREHQELHDSIARLITEVDALKLQNAGITQAKVTLDAQLHIAALALLSKDNELEAARHQISELRERLAGTTEQRDELSATLERRVATQRKKQRATRLLFEWAETAARSNLDDAFHFGIAAFFDVFAQGPTRPVSQREVHQALPARWSAADASRRDALVSMESLHRSDIDAAASRGLQNLSNIRMHMEHQLSHTVRTEPFRRSSHQRVSSSSVTSSQRRSLTPTAGNRPWYPPGATHAAPLPTRRLGSKSPSSSPRRELAPAQLTHLTSTLNNMQHLLAQLSSWTDGHNSSTT